MPGTVWSSTVSAAAADGTFAAATKIFYDKIRELLYNEFWLYKAMARNTTPWAGQYIQPTVHRGRNSGVGFRPAGGTMPTPGNQAYAEARIPNKFLYGRFRVDGPSIHATKTDKGAFASILAEESERLLDDIEDEMERALLMAGDPNPASATAERFVTGVLGRLSTNPADGATVLALDNAGLHYTGNDSTPIPDGTLFMQEGMVLACALLGDDGARTFRTGTATITSVNSRTGITVTPGVNADWADNDVLFRADANVAGQSSVGGLNQAGGGPYAGLGAVCVDGDGIYLNIAREGTGVRAIWQGNVLNNAGTERAVTLALIQEALDRPFIRTRGTKINMIVCHPTVRNEILKEYYPDRRYTTTQMQGGFSKLTYAGGEGDIPIKVTRYSPEDRFFALDTDQWTIFENRPLQYDDSHGSVIRFVPNEDAVESIAVWYGNIACLNPAGQVMVRDITATDRPNVGV